MCNGQRPTAHYNVIHQVVCALRSLCLVSRWRGVNTSTAEWIFVNYAVEIYDFALNLFWKLLKNKVCRILRKKKSHSVCKCILLYFVRNHLIASCLQLTEKRRQRIALFNASIMKSTGGETRGSPKILNSPWNFTLKFHSATNAKRYWYALVWCNPKTVGASLEYPATVKIHREISATSAKRYWYDSCDNIILKQWELLQNIRPRYLNTVSILSFVIQQDVHLKGLRGASFQGLSFLLAPCVHFLLFNICIYHHMKTSI